MKLLFLTNFYPPAALGGYELWCQEVAESLKRRGHAVQVLTSRHDREFILDNRPGVWRELHLEMTLTALRNSVDFFWGRARRETENQATLRRLMADFAPDVIVVWGMWNLSRSLAAAAEKMMPGRIVYFMGDYWPTLPDQFEQYWLSPPRSWVTGVPKRILGAAARRQMSREERPQLAFEHALFSSRFLQEELCSRGFAPVRSKIIYGAIDTSLYSKRHQEPKAPSGFPEQVTLLFVGRLTRDKGVHTAIAALSELIHGRKYEDINLLIAGQGDPDYEAELRNLAEKEEISDRVHFLGPQPKEALPALYQRGDIFLFTSIWPEPFGRVIVEAMASGTAVVGTCTGGAAEILLDRDNGLAYEPDNPLELAEKVSYLIDYPAYKKKLEAAARQTALVQFDMLRMAVEIELYCRSLLAAQPATIRTGNAHENSRGQGHGIKS